MPFDPSSIPPLIPLGVAVLLLALLMVKEIAGGIDAAPRARRLLNIISVALVPLLLAFALLVTARLVDAMH